MALLVGLTGLSWAPPAAHASTVLSPYSDPFYVEPNPMPNVAPGTVLGYRSVSIAFLGIPTTIQAWQLRFASRDTFGNPIMDVTTVLLPNAAAVTSPRPLLSYQVAEDADTMLCAPSYDMRLGTEFEEPLIGAALEQGWAVAVTDYEGLDSAWIGGVQSGHGVLDGIRAAESFPPLGLAGAKTPVGLWGYSGGALASDWAIELKSSYAPGLHIVGTAEGGLPTNAGDVARMVNGTVFSGIYFAAAFGLARAYPNDINMAGLLNPAGRVMEANVTNECIYEYVPEYAFQYIEYYTQWFQDPLHNAGVQAAIAADTLGQHTPVGPIFLYQSANDELVGYTDAANLAAKYCQEGVTVDLVKDEVSEHITLAVTGAGAALNYLIARFAGQTPPSTCATGATVVTSLLVQPSNNLVTLLTSVAGLTGFF